MRTRVRAKARPAKKGDRAHADKAQEALEQQAATVAVLKATMGSPHDVQRVFEVVLDNAARLCQASVAAVFLYDGAVLRNVAHQNASPAFVEALRRARPRPSRETTTRRCALERRTVHTADLLNDPEFSPPEAQRRENVRAALSVPMLREGTLLGVLSLWRREPEPFPQRQIALVETFADQAALAIENARLFNETREALEQQIATAEILGVVAQSRADLQPVFDAIARNATRLCGALFSCVYRFDGERVHMVATHNLPAAGREVGRTLYPMRPDRSQLSGRAVLSGVVQRLEDVAQDPEYATHVATAGGWRRLLAVPMLREAKAVGVIAVGWRDPGPILDRQVELLKTFADQAVIAIENARLFSETREALEQQRALAEVLGTISRSVADTKPVFDLILDSCQRLFEGHLVGMTLLGEDGMIRLGAYQGDDKEAMERVYPYPLARDSGSGQAILDRKVVHFPDVDAPGSQAPRRVLDGSAAVGFKSIIFAPLLGEGRALGALWVGRRPPGPFSEREIALLKTFADQAVIAIQNARLFRELEERGRQLEAASRHKSEFLANMSHELRTPLNAIIGFTRIVMRRSKDALEAQQYENLEKILSSSQHLLALINAVLDLSKVEAGRIEILPAETALAPVLEQCLRTVEPLARVALLREFDGGLPTMYVDGEKLRQIVLNLLSNAAKFTERGAIRLKAEAADGSVAIAVADTGIGIPQDKLEMIFEEFEQVDASSTRARGGTGLGLAIARRLARLMGGDVGVRSAPGAGSTFTLTLPLRYPG
jgi:signal transduction histidine kinase